MNEQQAIKRLKNERMWENDVGNVKALDIAIKALEEIKQYRALGTVEELREVVERNKAKKPIPDKPIEEGAFIKWRCPNCQEIRWRGFYYKPLTFNKVCTNCLQAIDWSVEE